MTPPRLVIPPAIVAKAMQSLRQIAGMSHPLAERAYRRWEAGEKAEPCKYGREQFQATDCKCEGCREKLAFFYFDQVALKFGRS